MNVLVEWPPGGKESEFGAKYPKIDPHHSTNGLVHERFCYSDGEWHRSWPHTLRLVA